MSDYNLKNLLESANNLKILYVEDDKDVMVETLQTLENIFNNILLAKNGQEGLEVYQQNPDIDFVLTDITMPVMNGIEMISHIRQYNKEIPILVISAYSDVPYFLDTIRLGIDGYILKPIESSQFFAILAKVVDKINLQKENNIYKHKLEQRVQEEIENRQYQEKILIQQSKLAAMGEMIDAIAHQWKQPINIIAMNIDMLHYDYEDNLIDKEYLENFTTKLQSQIKHMVNTLDEFRSFFRPNKTQTKFILSSVIDGTLLLIKDDLIRNKIQVIKNYENDFEMVGCENEFKHLILNIFSNARDAFNERNIQNRVLNIDLTKSDGLSFLEISDNAGGIPDDIIGTIFKPNVTTKEEGKGTGMGLYISTQIAHKYGGELYANNIPDGVKFTFAIK
ncbi:hybrid sensor histidine kinase/response regulator [Arcobacter sp. FWKO B]|uniref:hybrid sensor histidine kinase/response regulator n=1 Tax=Arcobacter sp. FWKO B TaxID=2593672 RepID=UPI0018A3F6CD|nr:hybrid sensor histidine kinase/response regulator [Arcobacter sp. FWKO B]QOG11214.1 hybrid sensor histidine kinase/response regulator [Arcobacter sp. FWKO B]